MVLGSKDPSNSENELLDCWSALENYDKFCNGIGVMTKLQGYRDLCTNLNNQEYIKVRLSRSILKKYIHEKGCTKLPLTSRDKWAKVSRSKMVRKLVNN